MIPPALTKEEWVHRLAGTWGGESAFDDEGYATIRSGALHVSYDSGAVTQRIDHTQLPPLIALANAALPDDDPYDAHPRKITHEQLRQLRSFLACVDERWPCGGEVVEELADILESYLPPRPEGIIESPFTPDILSRTEEK